MPEMPTTEELRAFVGPFADYYLGVWAPALSGAGPVGGGHPFAFFFPLFWLGLRRMWGTALVLIAALVAEMLVETAVSVWVVDLTEWSLLLTCAVGLTLGLVCVVCGNRWYLSYASDEIAEVRALGLSDAEHLAAVDARGGRSVGTMLAVVVVAFVAMWTVGMVIEAVTGW